MSRHKSARLAISALAIVVAGQAAILTFHTFAFWQTFGRWFVSQPLS